MFPRLPIDAGQSHSHGDFSTLCGITAAHYGHGVTDFLCTTVQGWGRRWEIPFYFLWTIFSLYRRRSVSAGLLNPFFDGVQAKHAPFATDNFRFLSVPPRSLLVGHVLGLHNTQPHLGSISLSLLPLLFLRQASRLAAARVHPHMF